jgi:hypothetical protein
MNSIVEMAGTNVEKKEKYIYNYHDVLSYIIYYYTKSLGKPAINPILCI